MSLGIIMKETTLVYTPEGWHIQHAGKVHLTQATNTLILDDNVCGASSIVPDGIWIADQLLSFGDGHRSSGHIFTMVFHYGLTLPWYLPTSDPSG
jgi:hypothetical protein